MALQDKTEPASQRRRDDARNEGRVAKSMDLSSAMGLIAALLIAKSGGQYIFQGLEAVMRDSLSHLHASNLTPDEVSSIGMQCVIKTVLLPMPLLTGISSVGFASNVLQVGMKIAGKSISPDMSRIDPFKGLGKLVSKQAGAELVKSLVKVGVISYISYAYLQTVWPSLIHLSSLSPLDAGSIIAGLCFNLLTRTCGAMLVIAVIDYVYQRFQFEGSIKMTKQEVKEEYKRTEGDPIIKSRVRQRQQEMSRKRMMQDVPKADVVITNPTHIAVALKYDSAQMSAPRVVAKGQHLMAERIKAIAEASSVPIVENVRVARLLYKLVEVGQQIPDDLFQTVAEILAYVYRLNKKAHKHRVS